MPTFARDSNRHRVRDVEVTLAAFEARLAIAEQRPLIVGPPGESFKIDRFTDLNNALISEITAPGFVDSSGHPLSATNYLYLVIKNDDPASRSALVGLELASSKEDRSRHSLMFDGQQFIDFGQFTGVQGEPGVPFDPAEIARFDGLHAVIDANLAVLNSDSSSHKSRLDSVEPAVVSAQGTADAGVADAATAQAAAVAAQATADTALNQTILNKNNHKLLRDRVDVTEPLAVAADVLSKSNKAAADILRSEHDAFVISEGVLHQSHADAFAAQATENANIYSSIATNAAAAAAAMTKAQQGVAAANSAAADAANAQGTADNANLKASNNTTLLATHSATLTDHESRITYNRGLADNNDGRITALGVKAEENRWERVKSGGTNDRLSTNESAISAIQSAASADAAALVVERGRIDALDSSQSAQDGLITNLQYDATNANQTGICNILLEGEVHSNSQVYFSTGSGAWVEGAFGVPVPRQVELRGYAGISSPEVDADPSNPVSEVRFPLYVYNAEGVQEATSAYELKLCRVGSHLVGVEGLMMLLPKLSQDGGNYISIGQPVVTGGAIHIDTRFRLTIDYKPYEHNISTYVYGVGGGGGGYTPPPESSLSGEAPVGEVMGLELMYVPDFSKGLLSDAYNNTDFRMTYLGNSTFESSGSTQVLGGFDLSTEAGWVSFLTQVSSPNPTHRIVNGVVEVYIIPANVWSASFRRPTLEISNNWGNYDAHISFANGKFQLQYINGSLNWH